MPRVKRGVTHSKRRKNILKDVKGFKWGRKNLIKLAQTARTKAGAHAFVGRKKKKRVNRALWQIKINAFVREHGTTYSKFIKVLKDNKVEVDRKVLADLAVNNKEVFTSLLEKLDIKKQ